MSTSTSTSTPGLEYLSSTYSGFRYRTVLYSTCRTIPVLSTRTVLIVTLGKSETYKETIKEKSNPYSTRTTRGYGTVIQYRTVRGVLVQYGTTTAVRIFVLVPLQYSTYEQFAPCYEYEYPILAEVTRISTTSSAV